MSYRDENSAQQSIRRNLNSVNLEPENRKALEAVAVMMAAAGKSGHFPLLQQDFGINFRRDWVINPKRR